MSASQKPNPNPDTNQRKGYVKFAGLAFQMLAAILLGVWLGMKLDQWLGFKYPIFTIVLAFLMLLGGMYYLVKSVSQN